MAEAITDTASKAIAEEIGEVWRVHDQINFYLLNEVPENGFAAVTLLKGGVPSSGRNVARVFAHMHAVRVSHVGREFLKGIPRFETGATPRREELIEAFQASGVAVEKRLMQLTERRVRIKHRPGLALLGYLMTHEAHHRGQILLALKQSAVRMPEHARFGIWEHWFRPKF
jgi:uncharacterized damage-inducible protein DinB